MNICRTRVLTGRTLATKLKRKSNKRIASPSEKAAHETDKTHRRRNDFWGYLGEIHTIDRIILTGWLPET
jgi:IS4 transposase